ncbi:MAG: hypothetical protein OEY89_09170 [Gammaproteobacteria bacterium]|nr:hypothetical protein [Gammaproteobacteria bacterium]
MFNPLTSYADDIDPDTEDDYVDDYEYPILPESPFISFIDSSHTNISSGIEYISSGIDAFFSNEKFYRETTSSYLRYRIDTTFFEGGEQTSKGELRVRIDLPITRKKLKLVFESDPIEPTNSTQALSDQTQETNNSDYYLGIEENQKEKEKKKWRLSRSLGVKVRWPLDFYVRLRITRDFPFDNWILKVNETLYWFDSIGSGFDTYLDFERNLSSNVLFRASSAARWSDENDYFTLSQFFSIFHTLSERRAISYYIGVIGQSQPQIHSSDYLIGSRYRQKLYRDWLFAEINPEIQYRKTADFKAEHKIIFTVEAFFGSKYL